MEVPDFYCMLAKAMDYDELEMFRQFIASGGKKGKFKWSSRDHAGTIPISIADSASKSLAMAIARIATMPKEQGGLGKKLAPAGYSVAERIAAGQGRDVAYICPDGTVRDKDRKQMTRTKEHIPYSFRVQEEFDKWLSVRSTQQK